MTLVHGSNLLSKEQHRSKYQDPTSSAYLAEIRAEYDQWHSSNTNLIGPHAVPSDDDLDLIRKRVALLESYKSFIDQQKYAEQFDARSNLHSTVLEEFLYYLFRDVVATFGDATLIGKSHAFKDIFFAPPNYRAMLTRPYANVEQKDHDFVIGVTVHANLRILPTPTEQMTSTDDPISETHRFDIPAVVIECKTYLDKTMLEGSSQAAEELKARNPNSMYVVMMEWLKLTEAVNLRKYKVDQIYVLRKQRNTDREFRFEADYMKNLIDATTVFHLFNLVRRHLTEDWASAVRSGLAPGWLL